MKKLIIPFTIKTYLANNTYADIYKAPRWSPDYTKVYNSALGAGVTPSAFAEYAGCLKVGAHLHFILPDAFTHGAVKDGVYDFPAVPNRYAVTRLYEKDGRIQVKCIIIESDFLKRKADLGGEDGENYTVIPYFDGTKTPYRFMGRRYAAGEIPASGDNLPKLTALGGGDPMFAAYYPTCRSVFGWYDDLAGVPDKCNLTYFVVGYFGNKADDPFCAVNNRADFDAVLSANGFTADGDDFCDSCVLFGEAINIEWKGAKHDYADMNPPTGEIDVSFGSTSAEAMSAVLAQKTLKNAVKSNDLEYQLTQLQYDLLKQSAQADGNFKIDDEIHKLTFRSLHPLEEYDELQLTDKNAQSDDRGNTGFSEYHELRRLQREAGRMSRELRFTREKMYRAWETYIQRYESHAADANTALEETKALIDALSAENGLLVRTDKIKAQVAAKRAEVVNRLPSGYALKTQTAEPFALPKEPVVMLSGDGIFRSFLFGEDAKDGSVYCQMTPQTSAEVPWEKVKAACVGLEPTSGLPFDYPALLYQAALNSPSLMNMLGSFRVKGEISPLAVNASPLELSQLFMDWQVDYYYTGDTATLGGWAFEHGETDYVFKGVQDGRRLSVSGRVPLTPHALYTLTAQLNDYQQDFPGVYDKVRDLPFISQELSGFTGELTGLRQVFQLPVTYDTKDISKEVEKYVDGERLSVNASELYPMRGGYVALSQLTLVGTFGQKQVVVKNGIYNKARAFFPYYMPSAGSGTRGMFPLAFSSSARLTVEFISQNDDAAVSTAALDSSPIYAVILPELLNNRLILYNENGEYAGMLKTVYRGGKRKTMHVPPPGAPSINAVLSGFIDGIAKDPDALPELISLIQDTLDKTVRTCESDFIWGVPLVLARLRARLEFLGGAEYSKKWADFGKYDDKAAGALKIPLKFGNMKRVTDGTVGVYEDGNFTEFHALWGADEKRYNGYVTTESPSVSANDGDKYFTAFLVPNSDLHIETGLLPAVKARIDSAHTSFAEKLVPAAEINPIIADIKKVELPSAEDGFQWRYKKALDNDITEAVLPIGDIITETVIMDGFLVKEGGD